MQIRRECTKIKRIGQSAAKIFYNIRGCKMEKQIIINNQLTNFWIDTEGRVRNARTQTWYKGALNKGYRLYNIYFKGSQYTLYAHKLVAEYFIPNPNKYTYVHHIDGNKLNNNVVNLEWVDEKLHNKIHGQGYSRKRIKINDEELSLQDIASFRGSPYYADKNGKIYNMSKKTEMRQEKTGNYRRVQCYYNLGGKHYSVHKIVWESFNGPIPKGYEVDHIDGDPNNNALSNLQLITHKENCQKANHKNIKIYSENATTKEITHYSSQNMACKAAFNNLNERKMKEIISNHILANGCYWYYEE